MSGGRLYAKLTILAEVVHCLAIGAGLIGIGGWWHY